MVCGSGGPSSGYKKSSLLDATRCFILIGGNIVVETDMQFLDDVSRADNQRYRAERMKRTLRQNGVLIRGM